MSAGPAGIVDVDVALPSGRVSAAEIQAASGLAMADILEITQCDEFPALGEYEQSWELAVEAAQRVLDRTDVAPEDIGQVIWTGSGEWDTPFWSPAAKVAHELGIDRAHCFEVSNFCNAAMVGLRLAAERIELGRSEFVLVLAADRLSQLLDYTDPNLKPVFNFGDAAGAVLLGRQDSGRTSLTFLHSAMRTDPSWCDYYGGEILDDGVAMRRRGHRPGLGNAYLDNFTNLVDETLRELDRKVSDIAYLLVNQGDRNVHERLLAALGLPAERSVFNYHRFGHMGGADTLIALRDLADQDRLRPGDLVLLATSGMGFSWGVTALEVRAPLPRASVADS